MRKLNCWNCKLCICKWILCYINMALQIFFNTAQSPYNFEKILEILGQKVIFKHFLIKLYFRKNCTFKFSTFDKNGQNGSGTFLPLPASTSTKICRFYILVFQTIDWKMPPVRTKCGYKWSELFFFFLIVYYQAYTLCAKMRLFVCF